MWQRIVDSIPASPAGFAGGRNSAPTSVPPAARAGFYLDLGGQGDLAELKAYLGDAYDENLAKDPRSSVESEHDAAASDTDFYRSSRMYLYDLTAFAMTGTKRPYHALLRELLPRGAGCSIGGAESAAMAYA